MKKRYQILFLSCSLIVLLNSMDYNQSAAAEVPNAPTMIPLLPMGKGNKVDVSQMKVKGRLRDDDKADIISLFGRIKGVENKPRLLVIEWDDFSFACRIKTNKEEVFFVKVEGNWVVSAIADIIP